MNTSLIDNHENDQMNYCIDCNLKQENIDFKVLKCKNLILSNNSDQGKNFNEIYCRLFKGQSYQQTIHLISPNELFLAISHYDQLIIYHIREQKETLKVYENSIKIIAFSADSNTLYIKFNDQIIGYAIMKQKTMRQKFKHQIEIICQKQIIISKNQTGDTFIFMKNFRKQIMKVKPLLKDQRQIDLIYEQQAIIQANQQQILIKSVSQQKARIQLDIENLKYLLIPNTEKILVITKQTDMQLWELNYQKKQFFLIKNLTTNIAQILSQQKHLYFQLFGQLFFINNIGTNKFNKKLMNESVITSKNYVFNRTHYPSVYKFFTISVTLNRIDEILK